MSPQARLAQLPQLQADVRHVRGQLSEHQPPRHQEQLESQLDNLLARIAQSKNALSRS